MKLSSTSALVLLWAGREHLRGASARAYLDRLDLEEGRALLAACDAACPYYAEVIRNRKHGVREFVKGCIAEAGVSATQVVIAGAGLDPLGIDLVETHPGLRVFEVDRENMSRKADAVSATGGVPPVFVEADLGDVAAVSGSLRFAGWNPLQSTVLVLEGITYYLEPATLRALADALRPRAVVAEYLKPADRIDALRASIPDAVFGRIAGDCALPAIHRHDADGLAVLLGMRLRDRRGMMELERARTNANRWFPADASGWIEVALLERAG